MRLFCFSNHDEPEPRPRNLRQELLEARAKLARYELLPDSSFTRRPDFHKTYQMRHGVDEKPRVIAGVKADIAALEVLIGGSN